MENKFSSQINLRKVNM